MVKFFLITLLIWFVLTRLLRFRLIVFRNSADGGSGGFQNHAHSRKEGTIVVDKVPKKEKEEHRAQGGDYVDFEEV